MYVAYTCSERRFCYFICVHYNIQLIRWGTILRVFQQYIPKRPHRNFILFIYFFLPQFRSRDMNLLNTFTQYPQYINICNTGERNFILLFGIIVIFRRENTPQFPVCFYSSKYNSVLKCFYFLFILDLTDFLYRM